MRRVAGRAHAVAREFRHDLRFAVLTRIPDCPHVHQRRRVAHEGGRRLVVRRARLAGDLTAEPRRRARRGAVLRGAEHRVLHELAVVRVEHLLRAEVRLVHLLVALEHAVDNVQRVLRAVVRDRRVPLREVPHGERVDAEDVVERVFLNVAADARIMRDLGEFLRRQMLVHVHEHRVHRVRGRLLEVDRAPAHVERVRHLCPRARRRFEAFGRIAVEHRVEVHVVHCCAEQTEGLHGGARLEVRLRGVVELVLEVVAAAVDRLHRAGLLVERDAAHLNALRHAFRPVISHRLHDLLHVRVERAHDLVSAGLELVFGERLARHELVLHGGEQVAVRPGQVVAHRHWLRLGELRLAGLLAGDVAVFAHDADHARESALGLRLVHRRVPHARCRDDAGDHRRLVHGEVFRLLAEVRFRRRLYAVCAAAQVDRVHVVAQHLLLVLRIRDLHREYGLANLARIRGGVAQIIPFRILLRDRGAALPRSRGQIVVQSARHAHDVNAAVAVERAVFGGDDRVAHVVRQHGAIYDLAVLLGERADLGGAVVVVDRGLLGDGDLLRLRNVGGHIQVGEQADANRQQTAEHAEQNLPPESLFAVRALLRAFRGVLPPLGRAVRRGRLVRGARRA